MKISLPLIGALFGVVGAAHAAGTPNEHANGAALVTHSAPVCPGPASAADARCHARVVTDAQGVPIASGVANPNAGRTDATSPPPPPPAGAYGPAQFRMAYGLTSTSSGGRTVAIVDAYDNPRAEADLAVYSNAFGLPACTTANGCFKKVNQTGGTAYPRADAGWALEIALDIQAVHAVCPDCKILLVEARSNSLSNLLTAVNYAASRADVVVVSNSWGAGEFSSEASYDKYFDHGKPITVSSGDNGYGVEWPAASPKVTAVGGTTLYVDANNQRTSEVVWKGAGSGCSKYAAQPAYQNVADQQGACGRRLVADVAAVADPATGAAVYDSYGYAGKSGWFTVGGTSLAAPVIAAIYALAGNTGGAAVLYPNASMLYDVTSGNNGTCGNYLCQGTVGYDGPTGLGAPNGVDAFR
ncbi:MAG: S53 family peptidase [Rhodocyclaceae bacterium]|nr:S53 family peptidase [Rhodocyclaceae bacterium]MBX3669970.1 S53 family peptidase [Rhodocyclaceae bacterium]